MVPACRSLEARTTAAAAAAALDGKANGNENAGRPAKLLFPRPQALLLVCLPSCANIINDILLILSILNSFCGRGPLSVFLPRNRPVVRCPLHSLPKAEWTKERRNALSAAATVAPFGVAKDTAAAAL